MRISAFSLVNLLPLLTSAELLTVVLSNNPASVEATPTASFASESLSPIWSPLYTRTLAISIPIPTSDEIFHNHLRPHDDLRVRAPEPQVTGQGPGATLQPTQVSPITTAQLYTIVGGSSVLIEIVYTQLFTTPLDPWTGPVAGAIGLGTIQGEVGVVKTKRDVAVQTQLPIAILSEDSLRLSEKVDLEVAPSPGSPAQEEASKREQELPASGPGCGDKPRRILENKTGKAIDLSAGSALALILAIAAMVVA